MSKPLDRQHDWESRYQSGSTGWDRGQISPALAHWLEAGALQPCRILVPGCGHGHEVIALARAGFEVTAVDIAPSAVQALKEQLQQVEVGAHVIQTDLLHWDPGEPFDAVYEQTFLCALSPEDWQPYAVWLDHWLKQGGRLFALFMQTGCEGGPPYHCDLDAMRRLFPSSRWAWSQGVPLHVPHPSGFTEYGFVLEHRTGPQG